MATTKLKHTILDTILDKKGKDITVLDITKVHQSLADYFIICHADSTTQVCAIADSIEKDTRKNNKTTPISKEGKNNSLWILLDYGDIVVHIFKQEQRDFYKLEELWADAKVEHITEE